MFCKSLTLFKKKNLFFGEQISPIFVEYGNKYQLFNYIIINYLSFIYETPEDWI